MGSIIRFTASALVLLSAQAFAGQTAPEALGSTDTIVRFADLRTEPSSSADLPKPFDARAVLRTTPTRISLNTVLPGTTRAADASVRRDPPATVPLPPAAPAGLVMLAVLALAMLNRRVRVWIA